MAMLASSVLPMLMQPEVRKGMGKLAKYLLIFGGLGVGILAYIIVAKKWNPLKSIGGWLKKGMGTPLGLLGSAMGLPSFKTIGADIGKGVAGFQKDIGKGVKGFQKDIGRGVKGFQKDIGKGVTGFQKDITKGWTGFWGDIGKGVAGFQKDVAKGLKGAEQKRREIKRVAKPIVREIEALRKVRALPAPMVARLGVVKSVFKKVQKKPVRALPKKVAVVAKRKAVAQKLRWL